MTASVTKLAADPDGYRNPCLFYRSAREGMRDLLSQDEIWRGDRRRILLPSFIGWSALEGSGVFDPVAELGLQPGFYDLDSDLGVDLVSMQRALSEGAYDVVVVIHYFGRTERAIDRVRQIAENHGVLLLEDLAHGYFTHLLGGPAGRTGEVSLYSLHKMLPMPDAVGGMVTYRNVARLTGQRETAGHLSRRVLERDSIAIARRRQENFRSLCAMLQALPERGTDFDLMWTVLDSDDSPQTLPVRILGSGRQRRDHVYKVMNADGFGVVSLYHTLIPELADHASMTRLSTQIMNFPVHQDVVKDVYPALVDSFRRALASAPGA